MSLAEYADHRKVSRGYISRLKGRDWFKGALVKVKGRKVHMVNSEVADEILDRNQDRSFVKGSPLNAKFLAGADRAESVVSAGDQRGDDGTFIQARTWSERYKAAERKLNYEIKQSKWVPKAKVRDEAFKIGRILRDALINVGPRISALVAAETSEDRCLEILTKEHNELLKDVIRQLNVISE